jgi:succinate dehydrogenase / fumarate reductase, cytochrome b subunit
MSLPGPRGVHHKERKLNRMIESLSASWALRAFTSSIGQKLIMAITGLGLCGFLVVHLAGNLLLYAGPEQYDAYADALHAQKVLLPIAEVGLLLMFILHIWLAIRTTRDNASARPVGYAVRQSKMPEGPLAAPAASIMFPTGIVVLLFLMLHLSDFKFGLRGHAGETPFTIAVAVLQDPLSALVYIVGSLVLGYHVLHGFQSAIHTLGFDHAKYRALVKFLSLLFAIVIAVGFGGLPLWAWAFPH